MGSRGVAAATGPRITSPVTAIASARSFM
jgi:hypothetical protein